MSILSRPGALAASLALAAFAAAAAPAHACPTHAVKVPREAGKGPAKEVKVLLDTPFVKLVSLTLRGGQTLEEHAVATAITVQALAGSGTVTTAGKAEKIGPGDMLLIGPNAKHAVRPDKGKDLVLLLHFLKTAGKGGPHDHHGDAKGGGGGEGGKGHHDCGHHGGKGGKGGKGEGCGH
jgi:quercetin dioxygenase-like cupin family protein